VPGAVAVDVEARIAELVEAYRPELEQLVDQALERELAALVEELVEERLAARNGDLRGAEHVKPDAPATLSSTATAATKQCSGCGETKPAGAFEKHRSKCRECRRRDLARARERRESAEQDPPTDPDRPAAIPTAELLARVKHNGTRAPRLPVLLDEPGIGPASAAQVLLSWSHHGRFRSEAAFARLAGAAPIPASSDLVFRHRLDRGGDRQLNRALHTIVVSRRKNHGPTIAYVERRRAEGKSTRETIRCLNRYLARHLFRLLEAGPPTA
jgi:transposase